ncbi:hypothetical protein CO038_01575 [Candidatus Pacearchaeota archaeon CG_4_9_14_0_2_um_filter_39_13]|nr:segregation/condensation protein A [Candidatus Pacearchaeota archaeon]OIO42449.1 MAG: hypothetical protein AUJ64_04015 [Candidatus Pacearchaeota archaeon CG1_02_39_14]PJC44821.1 MAG: hypothetical protein CO038_01575 [Candidatus Pacearchaeota archaeon CG_4_9_14_0_2_um_filter_39_13]
MLDEEKKGEKAEKVGQEQIHELLFGEQLSWQSIIYDLVNSEQLNPWDIDIAFLVDRYLERVKELEEANFFVSSKVLLAASILLRMKSDVLLHEEIPGLDVILFGKKEEKKYVQERIELEDDLPSLIPRTPLPRFRKVTLSELMSALGDAIKTENRRIRKEVVLKKYEMEMEVSLPKKVFDLESKIKEIYQRLAGIFEKRSERFPFSGLEHKDREEKIHNFVSLLHLDNQQKIWLEQEGNFEEIWIWLKALYEEKNKETIDKMRKEAMEELEEIEEAIIQEEIDNDEMGDVEEITGFPRRVE